MDHQETEVRIPAMTAYRLPGWQQAPQWVDVPVPRPRQGEVLVKVGVAGLCRSDLLMMDAAHGALPFAPPYTLGHETAGWVERVGAGVTDLRTGDPVLVGMGPRCGHCDHCLGGAENLCARGAAGRGHGLDGGLAEYLTVSAREAVRLATLTPASAAPLACAGITAYHPVRRLADRLRPGSTTLVIGVGGVGSYAVQLLRQLSATRILAVDTTKPRLELAVELGAHEAMLAGDDLAAHIREATGGRGVDVVLDVVGSQGTVDTALATVRPGGAVAVIGAGGGVARLGWATPKDCEVFVPISGTMTELRQLVALAESGRIRTEVDCFAPDRITEAYEALRTGQLRGRAVVVMDERALPEEQLGRSRVQRGRPSRTHLTKE
ncbi:alcohol dehydrogenase catalytic domain-containing protein [Streptomyces sp. NPDC005373]|uniref:alcohol dehydrogenase catalytic domain-containing protein n=1 Tax=unclassified Streptomyces TaxID=2593676 RepID=UPI0033B3DF99